jgi:hypothetical protein
MFSFTNFKTTITGFISAVVEVIKKKTIDLLFNVFWTGNYYMAITERKLEKNSSNWILQKILFRKPILSEPPLISWYSCSTFVKTPAFLTNDADSNLYEFNEKYSYSSEEEQSFATDEVEKLYISKKDGYRVSRISTPKINYVEEKDVPKKSKLKFISILYGHKKMSNMLTLKLDPEFLREGNNLFSRTFVMRLLKYTYPMSEYVFDDDYELKIMDEKIHSVVLKYNTYLVVNEASQTGYTIVSNE